MKYYAPTRISENIHETPEGYLLCVGVSIGRVGEMVYADGETPVEAGDDGKVIITRDADDLFSAATMASFEGKPFTIRHPGDFVGPDNWNDLAKGIIQNVRRGQSEQEGDLIADILVTDQIAIGLVRRGMREVSCGYEAEYVQIGKGKGKQTKIIGNHLALVEAGRAGPAYAITDHKGKEIQMTLKEKIKAMFAKAQDEALMTIDADMEESKEKKDDKAKDEGAMGYDELVAAFKDLGAKVEAMSGEKKASDEGKEDPAKEEEKEAGKDEASVEDRLKALEAAVAKIMESESGEAEVIGDEEEEAEESEDGEMDVQEVGDEAADEFDDEDISRAEILAPGIKTQKNLKVEALKTAYKTERGKALIDSLTGGKPTFDSAEKVETLFIAASEVLKSARTTEFSKSKQARDSYSDARDSGFIGDMTAEKLNEINAARWKQ